MSVIQGGEGQNTIKMANSMADYVITQEIQNGERQAKRVRK
jgi:hypothetical protein